MLHGVLLAAMVETGHSRSFNSQRSSDTMKSVCIISMSVSPQEVTMLRFVLISAGRVGQTMAGLLSDQRPASWKWKWKRRNLDEMKVNGRNAQRYCTCMKVSCCNTAS